MTNVEVALDDDLGNGRGMNRSKRSFFSKNGGGNRRSTHVMLTNDDDEQEQILATKSCTGGYWYMGGKNSNTSSVNVPVVDDNSVVTDDISTRVTMGDSSVDGRGGGGMNEMKSEIDPQEQEQGGYSSTGVCNRRMYDILLEQKKKERLQKADEEAIHFACTIDDQDPIWKTFLNYCTFSPTTFHCTGGDGGDGSGDDQDVVEIMDDDDYPVETPPPPQGKGTVLSWNSEEDDVNSIISSHPQTMPPKRRSTTSAVTPRMVQNSIPTTRKSSSSIEVIYDKDHTTPFDEGRRCTGRGNKTPTTRVYVDDEEERGQPSNGDEGRRCTVWGKTSSSSSATPTIRKEVGTNPATISQQTMMGEKKIPSPPLPPATSSSSAQDVELTWYVSPPRSRTVSWDEDYNKEAYGNKKKKNDNTTTTPPPRRSLNNNGVVVTNPRAPIDEFDEGRRCTVWGKPTPGKDTNDEKTGNTVKKMKTKSSNPQLLATGKTSMIPAPGDKIVLNDVSDKSRSCMTLGKKPQPTPEIRVTRYVSPPRSFQRYD